MKWLTQDKNKIKNNQSISCIKNAQNKCSFCFRFISCAQCSIYIQRLNNLKCVTAYKLNKRFILLGTSNFWFLIFPCFYNIKITPSSPPKNELGGAQNFSFQFLSPQNKKKSLDVLIFYHPYLNLCQFHEIFSFQRKLNFIHNFLTLGAEFSLKWCIFKGEAFK